jgi:hypothetical protein
MLAPLRAAGENNLVAIHIVMVLFATPFIFSAGRYFALHESLTIGLGVTAMRGALGLMTRNAGQVLTDLPFCALKREPEAFLLEFENAGFEAYRFVDE